MIYRLHPLRPLEWCDFPGRSLNMTPADGGNLCWEGLKWAPTDERSFSEDLLRIALRHGIGSPDGLIVDALDTVNLGRADELWRVHRQAAAAHQELDASQGALLESLLPGNREAKKRIDVAGIAATQAAVIEAETEPAVTLAAPIQPALAKLWVQLGGRLPT